MIIVSNGSLSFALTDLEIADGIAEERCQRLLPELISSKLLPEKERNRLAQAIIPQLVENIESAAFKCEGGSLKNFTDWIELKRRLVAVWLAA